jgi:7tm Odorant receptor
LKFSYDLQGVAKLQAFWLNRNQILDFDDQILKFHKSASSEKSRKNYEKYSAYSKLTLKIMVFLYFGAGLSILNPILVKLVTGELVLPYGFKLPWLDEFSFFGYSINFLYHLLQDFYTVLGYCTSDGIYAIEMLNIYCVYDDLCLMLDDLNEDLKDRKKKKSPIIREKMVIIIKKHQALLRFEKNNLKT